MLPLMTTKGVAVLIAILILHELLATGCAVGETRLHALAEPKPRSRKHTYAYLFPSMRSIRFLLIAEGRPLDPNRRSPDAPAGGEPPETLYGRIAQRLAA